VKYRYRQNHQMDCDWHVTDHLYVQFTWYLQFLYWYCS